MQREASCSWRVRRRPASGVPITGAMPARVASIRSSSSTGSAFRRDQQSCATV
jgi:hypothetical protein